jgi:hypothetical protein
LGALIGVCALFCFTAAKLVRSFILIANGDGLRWAFCPLNLLNIAPFYLIDSTTAIIIRGMCKISADHAATGNTIC